MIGRDRLVLVIFFWTFSICLTVAQTVTGKLKFENGSPSIGAVVFLGVNESTTNARGIFRFYDVEPGDYPCKVELEEGSIISLKNISVTGGNQDLGEIEIKLDQSVSNATDIAIISINTADIGGEGKNTQVYFLQAGILLMRQQHIILVVADSMQEGTIMKIDMYT